jgi:hypothetical protein
MAKKNLTEKEPQKHGILAELAPSARRWSAIFYSFVKFCGGDVGFWVQENHNYY